LKCSSGDQFSKGTGQKVEQVIDDSSIETLTKRLKKKKAKKKISFAFYVSS